MNTPTEKQTTTTKKQQQTNKKKKQQQKKKTNKKKQQTNKKTTNWQRTVTQEVSGSIFSNDDQIIYFSLTIHSLGFEALASIVF